MFTFKEYVSAKGIKDAYELLNQNKNNVVLGGLLWLKMGRKHYNTAINLSHLGLDTITETESEIEIGCMTTLRQIETSPILNHYFNGVLSETVKHIVGVQFRNCATIGGSVYARFGFSDVLTTLLALDTYVHLYEGGIISLEQFVNMPYKKDILIKIIIKKNGSGAAHLSHRITATDFPVLAVSLSLCQDKWKIAVGARPTKAKLAYEASNLLSQNPLDDEIDAACCLLTHELNFGTNLRGSSEYRKILAKVLVKRGVKEICG
ncbi:MAG: FAD binding domain-containing protein [Clostridia bacterium]|nr:FAD binding domain-containing protein [Clostridia bacterium]